MLILRWKAHRFFLKLALRWRTLRLGNLICLQVRHLAEGSINYVFRVRGEPRLLRISRRQFYHPGTPIDEDKTREDCRLMNALAEWGLSVACQHLYGGACLVEHAGEQLSARHIRSREVLPDVFNRIKRWSAQTGIVLLDYNEGNWCVKDGRILLVDIDSQYTCPLRDIKTHPLVTRRVPAGMHDDLDALSAFLSVEEQLLWDHLQGCKS